MVSKRVQIAGLILTAGIFTQPFWRDKRTSETIRDEPVYADRFTNCIWHGNLQYKYSVEYCDDNNDGILDRYKLTSFSVFPQSIEMTRDQRPDLFEAAQAVYKRLNKQ